MQPTNAGPTPRAGLVLGRVGDAPVVVHGGWFVMAALLVVGAAPVARRVIPDLGPTGGYLVGAGFASLFFGSVLLHELSHAWVARHRGVEVRQIRITLVGGHTSTAQVTAAATSALIAVAGPFANLVVAAVAWWGWQVVPDGGVPSLLLVLVASSNAAVAALNLLPGLPMDGGWILEALVWRMTGRRSQGTLVAAWIGRAVAIGLVVYVLGVPLLVEARPNVIAVLWVAVVGALLWTSAGSFLRGVALERAVERFVVADLAVPAVGVPAEATLAQLPTGVGGVVVVSPDGRPVGYLDPAAVAAVPVENRAGTSVAAVLVRLPEGAVVDGRLRGRAAVEAVTHAARVSPVIAVRGPDHAVTGLLRYADILRALRQGS